ncbi:GTPase/DUF3482 domain-containing protein [Castellaniella hirudinis]|uniref:GTPase/DUF3482 domain-containing protein n=1 Tax=Castellaniella hirudinis TaxID=1144617 RepID=UPI0039C1F885
MTETPAPIDLAVVGHTNTGKTSLLRTLLRDEQFGEVADEPGTTRHVESARLLSSNGQPMLILRDTPGLEDAMGVLDYLDQLIAPDERLDGPDRIQRLLDSPEAAERFEQECRVLAAVLSVDAALYVIDVRDPVLPKHRDELALLAACGRPILPVLNFTRSPLANVIDWRDALARLGLHATVDFDTVAPALDGESQLLDRLALMLDQQAPGLMALRTDLGQQRLKRLQDATRLIAELLMDAAALRLPSLHDPADLATMTLVLRKRTREREQSCVHALLKRYRFSKSTFPHHPLPLEGERWGMDLFSPLALREFGIKVSKGLATGAVAGATVDVLTGGLSLGTATLLGAAIGGVWQGANQWGKRLIGKLAGQVEMTVDDPVLHLLGLRQLALVRALECRGHAAMRPISQDLMARTDPPGRAPEGDPAAAGDDEAAPEPPNHLPPAVQTILNEARSHPGWSTIGEAPTPDPQRELLIGQMAHALFLTL